MIHRSNISRRTLLQGLVISGGGLALGVALPGSINSMRSTGTMMPLTTTMPPTPTIPPTMSPAEGEIREIETATNSDNAMMMETNQMKIQIGERVLTATLVDNSSIDALREALAEGPITIHMRDYAGMEKVGPFGFDLPRNDEPINAEAGDLILYQGNAFVIYYAPNAWNFTRLGKVDGVSAAELKDLLGTGNVTITLSLP